MSPSSECGWTSVTKHRKEYVALRNNVSEPFSVTIRAIMTGGNLNEVIKLY